MTDGKSDRGSLSKGIILLRVASKFPDGARFTDLAKSAGMSISTAHRVLSTLVETRMLEYDETTRLYKLGLGLFELTSQSSYMRSYHETAFPVMRRLSEETGHTISLNIFDQTEMVVLERADPSRPIQLQNPIGSREPLHSTASGKIILAALDPDEQKSVLKQIKLERKTDKTITSVRAFRAQIADARKNGFATATEENELGVNSLAVIIPLSKDLKPSSLAILVPSFMVSSDDLEKLVPELRAAASEIGHRLSALR